MIITYETAQELLRSVNETLISALFQSRECEQTDHAGCNVLTLEHKQPCDGYFRVNHYDIHCHDGGKVDIFFQDMTYDARESDSHGHIWSCDWKEVTGDNAREIACAIVLDRKMTQAMKSDIDIDITIEKEERKPKGFYDGMDCELENDHYPWAKEK